MRLSGLLLLIWWSASLQAQPLTVHELRCNYLHEPLGIDSPQPRFSWQLQSPLRNQVQSAYQIEVGEDSSRLRHSRSLHWDSGKVRSDQILHITYAGRPLESQKVYFWRVRVWDGNDRVSGWSAPSKWQMGLLSPADWQGAQWIGLEKLAADERVVPGIHFPLVKKQIGDRPTATNRLPAFRRTFDLKKPLRRATIFVCGLGHYELFLNGQRVGDRFLDPGWTNYVQYAYYSTYDVTTLLQPNRNALGALLGNGFFNIPRERYYKLIASYGYPMLKLLLSLEYRDGTRQTITTEPSAWRVTEGPITYTSIFGGEDADTRRLPDTWSRPDFNATGWKTPLVVEGPPELRSQLTTPLKIMERWSPVSVTQPKPGVWLYDMGQNASGIPHLTVRGKAGQTVRITPGELLNKEGLVNQRASGDPHYYQYTLNGQGTERWHPRFTYYGFRYLQIEGAQPAGPSAQPDLPTIVELQTWHTRNAAETTGEFRCSFPLFNQVFSLIDWSMKSNLASVLTDCPHREKLAWLEVSHLMASSFLFRYDLLPFYRKILEDMRAAQLPNGLVPDIAPEFVPFEGGFRDSPEWGSAAVILPWYLYQWYGDESVLRDNYDLMKRYVAYLSGKANRQLLSHGLGDWYDLGPKPPGVSQLTPQGLTATALYYYDLTILQQVAARLGKAGEGRMYRLKADSVYQAYQTAFFHPETGCYGSCSQTAQALSLAVGLVDSANRERVFQRLTADLKDNGYALTAGDVGFRYVIRALEEGGAGNVVYAMNSRTDVPGYGFQLAKGATALTESWPAREDVSNNHCMLGHLMEWFFRGLGGIQPDESGSSPRTFVIRPQFPDTMRSATVSYHAAFGLVRSKWVREGNSVTLAVEVPVNSRARIVLPGADPATVRESDRPIRIPTTPGPGATIPVGSGRYRFTFSLKPQ